MFQVRFYNENKIIDNENMDYRWSCLRKDST
uniref:Translational initiation factor 1 n=1 Tax=Albizia julibrissin TaxID=3813 RepID=A0A8E5KHS2_ALBJU|nr:translational initiation factor 1 [Albizia julibrissin]YP_010714558.1 translational initiation factor 1 [Albizia kalkora]QVH34198.1 translational initiation factor 1 [Albizia julibrissin]UYR95877.1 translational initiation factor 1 [Albizia julibrissin]WDD57955.1 translational initiation factor 1 [Albizia kalkora]